MTSLPLPSHLITWLATRSREESILNHRILVNLDWWNQQPETDGHPVTGTTDQGAPTAEGRAWISRRELFQLALTSVPDPLALLWPVVAWGTGTRHRLNLKRLHSIHEDSQRAIEVLQTATRYAAVSASDGFTLMLGPVRGNAFKYLGPAFFTKFLYFSGAGRPDHPCLIVDQYVLATLDAAARAANEDDDRFTYKPDYSAKAYVAAVTQMHEWARLASDKLGREVAGDEVERWAFSADGVPG